MKEKREADAAGKATKGEPGTKEVAAPVAEKAPEDQAKAEPEAVAEPNPEAEQADKTDGR